jgi:hypothetical protein
MKSNAGFGRINSEFFCLYATKAHGPGSAYRCMGDDEKGKLLR